MFLYPNTHSITKLWMLCLILKCMFACINECQNSLPRIYSSSSLWWIELARPSKLVPMSCLTQKMNFSLGWAGRSSQLNLGFLCIYLFSCVKSMSKSTLKSTPVNIKKNSMLLTYGKYETMNLCWPQILELYQACLWLGLWLEYAMRITINLGCAYLLLTFIIDFYL